MPEQPEVNDLLAQHREALTSYQAWDEKVKHLLQGRRAQDLTNEDMLAYREAAAHRDAAYDQMRHLERQLLDGIPDASSGPYPRVDPSKLKKKDKT
jgi:hypothetical protein